MSLDYDFLIGDFVDRFKRRLYIVKVFDKTEKPAGCKHPPNLLAHVRSDYLTFSVMNFANRFQNDAQSITGNMGKQGKIENESSCTFGYRTAKQFMQLVRRHFIEIASRSNNERMFSGFGLYAHVLQSS